MEFRGEVGHSTGGVKGGKIGRVGKEKIDISNISETGFYFSRYGMKYIYIKLER